MQNVTTVLCYQLSLRLPPAPLTPLLTAESQPTLHTIHRSGPSSFTLESHSVDATSSSSSITPTALETVAPSIPTALTALDDGLLLALRSGELYTLTPGNSSPPVAIGDVTHPDPARSGVLAASSSPDRSIIAVVSPVSLTLLDSTFGPLAEVQHSSIATHAAIRWRYDSEHLVLVLRAQDGTVSGSVIDRSGSAVVPLELGQHLPSTLSVVVDWQPRPGGALYLAGPDSSVSCFERNGLRHLRADLPVAAAGSPKVLRWSPDARLLAIAAEENDEEGEGDAWRVAFFTHVNYTWYCKKRVIVQHRVIDILWDEDTAGMATIISDRGIISIRVLFIPSSIVRIRSHAVACVVNGHRVELTNISRATVPPPLCHGVLTFEEDVEEICNSPAGDAVGVLLSDGSFETAILGDALGRPRVARDGARSEELHAVRARWHFRLPADDNEDVMLFRKPVLLARDCVAIIRRSPMVEGSATPSDSVFVYRLTNGIEYATLVSHTPVTGRVTATFYSPETQSFVLATSSGSISRLSVGPMSEVFQVATESGLSQDVIALYEFQVRGDRTLTLLHDESGSLEVIELTTQKRLSISRECTSFCVHEGFLCYTTRSHLFYCAMLESAKARPRAMGTDITPSIVDSLDCTKGIGELPEGAGATRPIDRGSLIVSGLPGDVTIVLQAPRGNLETIAPRPIVFDVVHRLAREREYGRAFAICRRQRVSMNHVVDANYEAFLENVPRFVAQVDDSAQLAVFMTLLEGPTERVNGVCDAVVAALREADEVGKYTNAILTGLVRRKPVNLDGAMRAVRDARDRSVQSGCAAVEYLMVLVKDEERVYQEALGSYDVGLAAFVAEASQLDPADYAMELHSLRGMEEWERKYSIDVKLERYDRALCGLFERGESKHGECVRLCHEHKLYDTALPLFAGRDEIVKDLLDGYGSHLEDLGNFDEAAGIFMEVGKADRAAECYRQAGRWELAVSAIERIGELSETEKRRAYAEMADDLADAGRMRDCARLRVCLLRDFEGALEALTRGEEWDAAFEVAAVAYGSECSGDGMQWWNMVRDAVIEGCENVIGMLEENTNKVRERGQRLEVLRAVAAPVLERLAARENNGGDDGESDALSSTTASSASSGLSDVTFASKSSTTSLYASLQSGTMDGTRLERQAAKRAARVARKRVREGDPREREYLAASLRKLVPSEMVERRVSNTSRAARHVGRADLSAAVGGAMEAYVNAAEGLSDDVVGEQDRARLLRRVWRPRTIDLGLSRARTQ